MVSHNNRVPNGHFHKNYKRLIKLWFNQPTQKKRRAQVRKLKIMKRSPRPAENLRPMVHCPTIRYNTKIRTGRGFTLEELKAAGLQKKFAQSVGIAVDTKRSNKSVESKLINVHRLKEYLDKLIIFPINKKKRIEEMKKPIANVIHGINKPIRELSKLEVRVPTKAEKSFCAYQCLHAFRFEAKFARLKIKHDNIKAEGLDMVPKRVQLQLLE